MAGKRKHVGREHFKPSGATRKLCGVRDHPYPCAVCFSDVHCKQVTRCSASCLLLGHLCHALLRWTYYNMHRPTPGKKQGKETNDTDKNSGGSMERID